MTQQTMTKEQIIGNVLQRQKIIKYIPYFKSAMNEAMEEYAQQEVAKERVEHKKEIERILSSVARGEKLAETLNFDGKSELQKEREKAKNLVEALEMCLEVHNTPKTIHFNSQQDQHKYNELIRTIKQSLTEYELKH